MADKYRVVIVDKNAYNIEEEGVCRYDLYEMWENNKELPDGVWVEEWLVPDGAEWNTHPIYDHHYLVEEECYLIDWKEIDKPHMIKSTEYWAWCRNELKALADAISPLIEQALTTLQSVREILDEDDELFYKEMPSSYETTDVILFYADLAEEALGKTEDEK